MKEKLKDYFTFTRAERNGIVVLLSIIVVLLLAPLAFPFFIKEKKADFSGFQQAIAQLQSAKQDTTPAAIAVEKEPVSILHAFDPNTASAETLAALGFSNRQVNTIVNYRNKGGKFFKKEDLQKVYGVKHL